MSAADFTFLAKKVQKASIEHPELAEYGLTIASNFMDYPQSHYLVVLAAAAVAGQLWGEGARQNLGHIATGLEVLGSGFIEAAAQVRAENPKLMAIVAQGEEYHAARENEMDENTWEGSAEELEAFNAALPEGETKVTGITHMRKLDYVPEEAFLEMIKEMSNMFPTIAFIIHGVEEPKSEEGEVA